MKTKKLLVAAAFVGASVWAVAQPTILYKKAFGGTWYEYASKVTATPDGGMALIGMSTSNNGDIAWTFGDAEAFVVKLNAAGTVDWSRVVGGTGYDVGTSISPTADGGFIIGGNTMSNDHDVPTTNDVNSINLWVCKVDAAGVTQWKKTFGGSAWDLMNTVRELPDGSFIIGGTTRSTDGDVTLNHGLDDCWIIKLDASGNMQWQKTFGGTSYDQLSQLIVTNDGGFAFTALTNSNDGDVTGFHGGYDVWMVKLDTAGNVQWKRSYGGTMFEMSSGLMQTSTGEYVLIANRPSRDGDGAFTDTTDIGDCWVVKISNTGNLLWENQYGGTFMESVNAVTSDSAGNYVFATISNSNDGNVTGHHGSVNKSDYWVFCLDTAGTLVWQKSFGGNDDDKAYSIALLNDGNLAVFGETSTNNNGDVMNSGYHLGTETVHPPNSPAFTVNTSDYWVIKISSPALTGIDEEIAAFDFTLAPNPATANFTVTADELLSVQVRSVDGKEVYSEQLNENTNNSTISVKDWAAGVYLVSVCTGKGVVTKKLIVAAR